MGNNAPIGVFDSGVGGISILIEIRGIMPAEDLIYMADSAHCPYGIKPVDEIRKRTLEVTDYLVGLGVKAVVVACNTACEAGLGRIRAKYPGLPVIGVEPAVKPAHQVTRNGKIGVLATNLTLNGERFSNLIEKYATGVQVFSQPAPGLVELVEAGELDSSHTETVLHKYLDPLLEKKIDTLVLGCTHYPFLKKVIQKICGVGVSVLDTGAAVARQTARILTENNLLASAGISGKEIFYTSGDPESVGRIVAKLWPGPKVTVIKANL